MRYFVILVTLCLIGFTNCSEEPEVVKMEYLETKCADPWKTNEGNTEQEVLNAVIQHLEIELSIPAIVKVEFEEDVAQLCEACTCQSGRKITVEVEEGFIPKLEEIGFVLK